MLEKLAGGSNFTPDDETLSQNFVFFSFLYHTQKILMLVLSFLVVQGNQLDGAALLGVGLTAWDMIFFTNFTCMESFPDTISMSKLLLKQITVIAICLLVATHGKDTFESRRATFETQSSRLSADGG